MAVRSIISKIFLTIALLGVVSCGTKNSNSKIVTGAESSDDDSFVTYDEKNDLTIVDLKDQFNKEDSFGAHEFIGENYAKGDPVRIKIITDAQIVKAEKIVHYYPTIWAGPNDEAIQSIYLFNLEYKDKMSLKVKDGIIEYPMSGMNSEVEFEKFFGKITKAQLLSSIKKVPDEYERKGSNLLYEMNSWKSEEKVWKKIANKYHLGELIDEENEPFDVDECEIELVVTFKNSQGLFTKTFCDQVIIGN